MFASYLDTTEWPTFDMVAHSKLTGQKWYTLAFIVSQGGNPSWGGFYEVKGGSSDWFLDRIQGLRSAGGDVVVSFGGQAGQELAQANSNASALYNKYKLVIDTYKAKVIDFDIEGGAIADSVSIDLRNKALAMVNKNYPNVQINYTLPVMPDGLDGNGLALVQNAKKNGVKVGCYNLMTMDYGGAVADMGQAAINAAQATRKQLIAAGYSGSKIGLTPMIGVNDVKTEIFTLANAQKVLAFANKTDYIGLLSFWSVQRDNKTSGIAQSPNEFTDIFKTFKPIVGPTPTPVPTPTPNPVPVKITPGASVLGQPVTQDIKPQWYKISGVVVGDSAKFSYTQISTTNIGSTLDALSRDSVVSVANYNPAGGIVYTRKGYDLTLTTDAVAKPGFTCWVRSSAAAAPAPTPVPAPSPVPTPVPSTNHVPIILPGNLTRAQIDTILSLVSIAENSSTSWWDQYSYCEDIGDGRGFTAGFYGFCSGTSDMLMVFRVLQKINPNHYLCKYIPALLAIDGTPSHTGLENLAADIKTHCDSEYQAAQWQICVQLYWGPSVDYAAKNGLTMPITIGQMYDTAINLGDVTTIQSRVKSKPPSQGGDEVAWLKDFLNVKQDYIVNVDHSLDNSQPDRCILWRNVLNTGNTMLNRPLKGLVCYGERFDIV